MGLAPERSKQKTGKILTEMSDLSSRQKQCEQKKSIQDKIYCHARPETEIMFSQGQTRNNA